MNDSTSVYFNGIYRGEIQTTSGIRQGCTGSPLLFVLVLNFIIDKIEKTRIGFRKENIRVPCLFFADDGLLLAQSADEMIRILKVLEMGAEEVGLKINKTKSNLMIYGEDVNYQSLQGIDVVSQMKYLGVCIGSERDIFHQHKVQKLKVSKRMSNMTYSIIERSCNKIMIGKTYWEMIVLPSLLFGSAIVPWNKTEIENLQRSENDVWRKILGAPGYAPL